MPASATLPDLWENDRRTTTDGYLTDVFSDRAAEFVQRPRSKPFYLSLHYTAPHSPWEGPGDRATADHADHGVGPMTNGGSLGAYAADDAQHGRRDWPRARRAAARSARARHARDLHERQRRRALLVQLAVLVPEALLYEGGIRVPAIVRWPGVVPAGAVTDQAAITMDWTATILAAAGAPADAAPLDGESLLPVLTRRA